MFLLLSGVMLSEAPLSALLACSALPTAAVPHAWLLFQSVSQLSKWREPQPQCSFVPDIDRTLPAVTEEVSTLNVKREP